MVRKAQLKSYKTVKEFLIWRVFFVAIADAERERIKWGLV